MPEQPSHAGRNVSIVAGAVLIIALGIFFYVHSRSATPASTQQVVQQPVTPQGKAQVLQSAAEQLQTSSSTSTQDQSSSAQASEHAQVLESAQSQGQATAPPTPPSQEQKMKILQSAGSQ